MFIRLIRWLYVRWYWSRGEVAPDTRFIKFTHPDAERELAKRLPLNLFED